MVVRLKHFSFSRSINPLKPRLEKAIQSSTFTSCNITVIEDELRLYCELTVGDLSERRVVTTSQTEGSFAEFMILA